MTMEAEIEGMLLKAKDASNARSWEGAWLCPCLDFVQLASRDSVGVFWGAIPNYHKLGCLKQQKFSLKVFNNHPP